ncbi:MAG: glycosyltransferase, partial [Thermoanaerobaculia bacterium]
FYPSEFLRRTHLELFPTLDPARQRVVAPEPVATAPARRRAPRNPPRHLAYVGSVMPHKGALVFAEVVRRLAEARPAGVRWSVYGGGDEELLADLRRLPGVRVRGYYRSGSLPGLLVADEVDLALLLSIVPESYGFTLSECRAAGVPVVAFDLGALGERLLAEGGGRLVPLEAGADGVAAVLSELLAR